MLPQLQENHIVAKVVTLSCLGGRLGHDFWCVHAEAHSEHGQHEPGCLHLPRLGQPPSSHWGPQPGWPHRPGCALHDHPALHHDPFHINNLLCAELP